MPWNHPTFDQRSNPVVQLSANHHLSDSFYNFVKFWKFFEILNFSSKINSFSQLWTSREIQRKSSHANTLPYRIPSPWIFSHCFRSKLSEIVIFAEVIVFFEEMETAGCVCEFCEKSFDCKSSLSAHRSKKHRELATAARKNCKAAKPYKCTVGNCQSSFSLGRSLNQHVKNVHGDAVTQSVCHFLSFGSIIVYLYFHLHMTLVVYLIGSLIVL